MRVHTIGILAALIAAFAVTVSAQTLDKAERTCAAAKLKATGQKQKAKLQCEAKALAKALTATDPECLDKAETKFSTAFGKAEAKGGCVSELDAAAVEASVDAFVANELTHQTVIIGPPPTCAVLNDPCGTCADGGVCTITVGGLQCVSTTGAFGPCPATGCPDGWACIDLGPAPPPLGEITICAKGCGNENPVPLDKPARLCAASKLKATSKRAHAQLKCEAKGIVQELPATDPECLGKAESKFGVAFGKAEEKGGCSTSGDAAEVGVAADNFVSRQVSRQTTGVGSDLPWCPTLGDPCGSCGSGLCVPSDEQGQVCVAPYGAPCPVEGCPVGLCISAWGSSACVTACP